MNQLIILLGVLFFSSINTFAAEGQSQSFFNNFHLLDMKCDPETHEMVETTPQSPPLDVDDPGTPGCNHWEINVIASADLSLHQKNYELPLLDINFGIGDNIQLKYEVPNVNSQSDTGATATAMGNSKVGLKYMFFENEDTKTQMALYPQNEFVTASAAAIDEGLASSGSVMTLPLLFTTKLGQTPRGDLMLSANVGYNISHAPDTSDYVSALIGLGTPISNKVSIMGELSTEQSISKNDDGVREQLVKANAGFLFAIAKQVTLFGSVGQSLYTSDETNHTYFLTGVRL